MNKPFTKKTYDTPYEVKPNSGSLRKSDKKVKAESPDYYGSFKLDLRTVEVVGSTVEFKLSGWKSVDTRGNSFLSLKVNTWKPEDAQVPQAPQQQSQYPEQDDEHPF